MWPGMAYLVFRMLYGGIGMRLWHQHLLPYLPRQQLLGQHRECCALRGKGWGKSHSTVNYVFEHTPEELVAYHYQVINEMEYRGYFVDPLWKDPHYRGKKMPPHEHVSLRKLFDATTTSRVYREHGSQYLAACIDNLKQKGILIELGR